MGPSPRPWHRLDPSLSPSTPRQTPSVGTVVVSTTAPTATDPTTPCLLSDTEPRTDRTTTWSRTRGEPRTVSEATSRWPETEETIAASRWTPLSLLSDVFILYSVLMLL